MLMYGWAGKQGRVYSPFSWVSSTISKSNGIDCAPTIDPHKAISALYHPSEWLFSIRATVDDCFQWEHLNRIKREEKTKGREVVVGLIVLSCNWLAMLHWSTWCRWYQDNTRIHILSPWADGDCGDKVGIKVMDVVRCVCVCVCVMCWQMGLRMVCVECNSIAA